MVESVNQTFGLATSPYTVASAKPNSEVRDVALLVFTNSLPANSKFTLSRMTDIASLHIAFDLKDDRIAQVPFQYQLERPESTGPVVQLERNSAVKPSKC